jgi:hypothetical protein
VAPRYNGTHRTYGTYMLGHELAERLDLISKPVATLHVSLITFHVSSPLGDILIQNPFNLGDGLWMIHQVVTGWNPGL